MRAAAEAVIEALREAGCFLVMKWAARFVLASGLLHFYGAAYQRGQACPCSQLIQKLRRKRHYSLA